MKELRESTWYSVVGMDPRLKMNSELLESRLDSSDGPFNSSTRGSIQEDRAQDLIQRHGEEGLAVWPNFGRQENLPANYTDAKELAEFIDVFDHHVSVSSGSYEGLGLNIDSIRIGQATAEEPSLSELAESLDGQKVDIYGKVGPTEHSTYRFLGDGSIKAGWIGGDFGYELGLTDPEVLADQCGPNTSADNIEKNYEMFEDVISSAYVQTMAVMTDRGYEFEPK